MDTTQAGASLVIGGQRYTLTRIGPRAGWIVERWECSSDPYEVTPNDETGRIECTCPDWRYRHAELPTSRGCKHIQAIVSAGLLADERLDPYLATVRAARDAWYAITGRSDCPRLSELGLAPGDDVETVRARVELTAPQLGGGGNHS